MTRVEAVRNAIVEMEKLRRKVSKNRMGLEAAEGMDAEFDKVNETVLTLKEICQVLQVEGVKKSIAQWQTDLIEDPESIRMAMSDLESR